MDRIQWKDWYRKERLSKNEIWKDIEGYEGLYKVSSFGRVKSLNYNHTRNEKIMKLGNTIYYKNVDLCKLGKRNSRNVHVLVAKAFIPNPENKKCVCHIVESIPCNNFVNNLFWGTPKENTIDMIKKGRSKLIRNYWKGKKSGNNPSSIKISQYTLELKFIRDWDSISEAKSILEITGITNCLIGKNKTAGGFIWKYKEVVFD